MLARLGKHADNLGDVARVFHKTIGKASHSENTYTVYRSVKDGLTEYIGITTNFVRRQSEHVSAGRIIDPLLGMTDLLKYDARGIEQVLIEHFGRKAKEAGGTLLNINNSISPKRGAYYEEAVKRGKDLLDTLSPGWRKWK